MIDEAKAELEASNHMIALLIARLGGSVTFSDEDIVTSRRVAIVASRDETSVTLTLRKK
jgi:hypothetical protein